ncbi:hypothetical protein DFJ58DRAFT_846923 [Suillus subalutaceus]|uniref:uncharacterized protein n=1 Tax=Suillus subalutaceus TaxID=48586 RepID=UPI001B87C8D0|nr:uncharacterized protein DFJ58DRAFT_846923 [Suillus subalutaceus]KAG1836503.1 hypothetical protein DFJ58DRAFT_846923 [Suillus subalutaceus]
MLVDPAIDIRSQDSLLVTVTARKNGSTGAHDASEIAGTLKRDHSSPRRAPLRLPLFQKVWESEFSAVSARLRVGLSGSVLGIPGAKNRPFWENSRPVPSVTVTLVYGDPTSTAPMGSVPLPNNAPTVSSVLAVVLIAIFLVIVVTCPWWKQKLPPFVLCGCCPFIVVHSERENNIPDIVDLAFARLDATGAGSKELRAHTRWSTTSMSTWDLERNARRRGHKGTDFTVGYPQNDSCRGVGFMRGPMTLKSVLTGKELGYSAILANAGW